MTPLSRREVLIGGASAVVGAGVVVAGMSLAGRAAMPTPSPSPHATVADWVARRTPPYFIGHRGAGGVLPEHTLPSYTKALEWGAECLELSVVMTSDGVLYCLHDLSLDRTTTMKGEVRLKTSAEVDQARVSIPRLGPRWLGSNMPPVPRLRDVLEQVGGKAVLCIEPKDDSAYPVLIELVEQLGLKDSVIIKLDYQSPRISQAQKAGYPIFAYLGNAEVATATNVRSLAKRLDSTRDVMVLPTRNNQESPDRDVYQAAVGTGLPIWVFPVHRRVDVEYFSLLGVEGMVAASLAYSAQSTAALKADDWASEQLTPGQLTRDPYSEAFKVEWDQNGEISIPTPGRRAFVCLGQFAPVDAGSYRIALDVAFDPMPRDTWQHISIAFGHKDDSYYEHQLGKGDGYHALLRANGSMALFAHVEGEPIGQELTTPRQSTPMKDGLWARMMLDVTPEGFQWSRDDGTVVVARDSRFRGGYFHVGSSAKEGAIKLRALTVG